MIAEGGGGEGGAVVIAEGGGGEGRTVVFEYDEGAGGEGGNGDNEICGGEGEFKGDKG